jgi:hypothetical protein
VAASRRQGIGLEHHDYAADARGQGEWRRGSPRRSGVGGVAGSGRRSGVPVEGGSDGVAAFLEEVLRLEAMASEGTAGVASERDEKHGVGENFLAGGGWQHPFKGGW